MNKATNDLLFNVQCLRNRILF